MGLRYIELVIDDQKDPEVIKKFTNLFDELVRSAMDRGFDMESAGIHGELTTEEKLKTMEVMIKEIRADLFGEDKDVEDQVSP